MGSPSPSSGPKLKRSSSTSRAQGPHRRSSSSISCVSLESGDQDLLYSSPAKSATGITGKSNVIPSSPRTPTASAGAASPAALKKRRSSIGGFDDLAKGLDFSISSSSPVNEEKKLHSFLTKGGGHKKVSPSVAQASGSPGNKAGSPVPGPREKLTVPGRAALSPSRKSSESIKKGMPSSPQKLPEVSRSMNGLTTPKKSSPLRASLDSKMLQAKLSSPRLTPKSTKAVRTLSELAAADALLEGELLKVQTFSPGNKKTERKPSPSPSLRSKSSGPKLTPSPPQLGRSRSRTDRGGAHTHAPELSRPEMQSVTVYSEYEFDKDAVKKTPDNGNMVQRDEEAEERSTLLGSLIQGSGNDGIIGVSSLDHEPTSWLSEDNVCMFSSLSQLPEPDDSLVLGDPPIKLLDEPVSSNGYANSAISSSNGVYDHHGSVDHELNSFCDMLDDPDDGFEAHLFTERDATFEPPQVDTFEAELRTQIETTFDSPQISVPQFVVPVVGVTSECVHKGETSIESDVSSSAGDDQSSVVIESFLESCSSQDLQSGKAQSQDPSEVAPIESAEEILQVDQYLISAPNVELEEERRARIEDEISTAEEQVVESSDDESLEEIVEDSQVNLKQSFDEVAESQNRDVDEFDHAGIVVPVMVDSPWEVTSSERYTIGLQELSLLTESEFAPQLYLNGPNYNLDQDMKIFEEDWTQSTPDDAGQNDAEDLPLLNTAEDEAEDSLPPVELPVSVLPVTGILKLNVEDSDQPHATKLEIVEQTAPDSTVSLDNHHAEVGATRVEIVEEIPPEEDLVSLDMNHHAEVGATNVKIAREIPPNDDPDESPDHHAGVSATKLDIVEETPPDSPVSLERYDAESVGATKLEALGKTPPKDAPDSPVSIERYHAELVGAAKLEALEETPLEDAPDSPVSSERYDAELVGATKLEVLGETPPKDAPDSPVSSERYDAELVGAAKLEALGETPLEDAPDSPVLERYDAELVGATKLEALGETTLIDAPDSPVFLERYDAELVGAAKLEALGETPLEDAPDSPVSLERYDAELVGATKLEALEETPLEDAPDSAVSSERYDAELVGATKLEVFGETPLEDAPDSAVSSERYDAELVGAAKLEALEETPLEDAPDSPVSSERYDAELVGAAKLEVLEETPLEDAPDSPVSSERYDAELVGAAKLEALGETPLEDAPDSPVSLERYDAELVGAAKLEALEETALEDAPDSPVSSERYDAELVGATKLEVFGETPLEDAPDSAVSSERYDAELVGAAKLEALGETPPKDAPDSPVSLGRYDAGLVGAAKLDILGETPPDSTVSSEYHEVNAAYEEEDEESDEVFHLYGAASDKVILFDVVSSPFRSEEPLNPILFQDVGEPDSSVDLHDEDVEGVELSIKNFPPHDTSGNDDSSSATGDVCVDHEEPSVNGVNIHNFDYDEYLHLEPDLLLGTTVQDGFCETSGVSDRDIAHVQSSGLEPSPENPITLEAVDFEGGEDDCNLKDFSGPLIPVDSETDEIPPALDLTDVEDGQPLLHSPQPGAATKEVDSSESGSKIDTEQASVMEDTTFHGDGGTTTRQERIENSALGPEVQMMFDPELEHQGVYNSDEEARGKLELNSTEFRDNSFQDTSLTSRDIEVTVQHSSQIIHGDEEDLEPHVSAVGVNMSEVDHEPQTVHSPVIVTLEDFSASDDDSVHNTFEDDITPDEFDAESEVISTASLDIGTEAPTDILGKDEVPFVFSAKRAPVIEFGRHDQFICEDDQSIVGSNVDLGEQHASKEMKPLLTVDGQCGPLHEESNVFHGRANPCSPTQEADARGEFTTEDLVIDEASSVREHHDVNIRETPFLFGTSVDHVSRTEDGPEVEKALSDKDGHAVKDAGIVSGNLTESQGLPSHVTLNGDDEIIKGDIIPDSSSKGDIEGESLEHNLSPEDVMDNIEKSIISSDQDTSSLEVNVDDREENSTVYSNGGLQKEPILFEDEEEVVFSAKNLNGCASLGPDISGTTGKDEENTTERSLLEVEDTSDGDSDIQEDLIADSEDDCFEEHAFLKDAHMAVERLDVAEKKEQSDSSQNPSASKDEDVLEDEENGVVQETLEMKDFDVCNVRNHSHVSWSRAGNEVEGFNGSCVEEEPMPEVDEDTVVYRSMELCGQYLPESTPLLVDEGLLKFSDKVDPEEVNLNGEVVQDSVSEAEGAMPGVEEAMAEPQVENHEESLLDVKLDRNAEALMVDEESREEEEALNEDVVGKESTVEMVDDSPTSEESRVAPDVLHANAEKGDVEKEIQHPFWRTDEEGETSVKETPTVEVEDKEMSSPEESIVIQDGDISDLEKETQHSTWTDERGETLPEDMAMFEEKEVSSVKESHVVSDEDIANAGTSDADEGESISNGHLAEETVVRLKDQENGSSGHEVPDLVNESLRQSENTEGDAITSDKDTDEVSEDAVKVKASGPKEALFISDEDDTNADISDADQAESPSNGNLEEETVAQLKNQENGTNGNVLVCQVPGSLQSDSMGEELVHHSNGAITSDKVISMDAVKVENYHADHVDEDEESETLALVKETWIRGLERTPLEDMDSPDEEPQAAALYPLQPPFSGSKQDHLWEEQSEAYSSGGQGTPSCSHKIATAPPHSAQPSFSCDDQIQPASATLPAMEPKGKDKLHTPLRSLLLEDAHKAMDGNGSATSNGSPSFIRRLFRVKSTPSRAASERDLTQSKHKKSTSMWVSCLGSPQVKQ